MAEYMRLGPGSCLVTCSLSRKRSVENTDKSCQFLKPMPEYMRSVLAHVWLHAARRLKKKNTVKETANSCDPWPNTCGWSRLMSGYMQLAGSKGSVENPVKVTVDYCYPCLSTCG